MSKLKTFYLKYRHGIPLIIYAALYLTWFVYLEKTVTKGYQIIYMKLDDYIPFCELFVIPYFLWFLYIVVVICYLLFKDKTEYYRAFIFLTTGMTIFLVVSTLWPNGHHLRPLVMPRDNILTAWVSNLYGTDTATNLWPSIHVYNSIGAHIAVMKCKRLEKYKAIRIGSGILATLIVLSTVFIKQHSVFDVLTAFIMAAAMYVVVYKLDIVCTIRTIRSRKRPRPLVE
ncbi:MAG: phosphatase PAP2 family protein [Lachnospiraceae bacterium]|nr:phosphatase PAP2 family protein [Lachnospiraceae bacterium]